VIHASYAIQGKSHIRIEGGRFDAPLLVYSAREITLALVERHLLKRELS
jgi:hypothetical protein